MCMTPRKGVSPCGLNFSRFSRLLVRVAHCDGKFPHSDTAKPGSRTVAHPGGNYPGPRPSCTRSCSAADTPLAAWRGACLALLVASVDARISTCLEPSVVDGSPPQHGAPLIPEQSAAKAAPSARERCRSRRGRAVSTRSTCGCSTPPRRLLRSPSGGASGVYLGVTVTAELV